MHTCIYEGLVRHRRYLPAAHSFSYKLFYIYLDLDELDQVFKKRWFWSCKGPNLARFKRSDFLGDHNVRLKQAVIDTVEIQSSVRPTGPIRLLTHLRYFGYIFNPVNFYYCFNKDDTHVEHIVAEITNTPWGERQIYVLSLDKDQHNCSRMKFVFDKIFHVSPFMPMTLKYDWRFTSPSMNLTVHMNNFEDGNKIFDATLSLARRSFTGFNAARALVLYPFLTIKVIIAIYWQAFRLFIKKIPFHTHPDKIVKTKGDTGQVNNP